MTDKIGTIKAWTLDDMIDNDPIAEGIYERFITINGMRQWYFRNDGIEEILKMADFGYLCIGSEVPICYLSTQNL